MNRPRLFHYDCPRHPDSEHSKLPMQPLYIRENGTWRRVGSRCQECLRLTDAR